MGRAASRQWYSLVAKRDGHWCQHCRTSYRSLTIDHIIPWSAGGSNTPSNLQLLCDRCNKRKADRPDTRRGTIRNSQKAIQQYERWAERHGVLDKWPVRKVLRGPTNETS